MASQKRQACRSEFDRFTYMLEAPSGSLEHFFQSEELVASCKVPQHGAIHLLLSTINGRLQCKGAFQLRVLRPVDLVNARKPWSVQSAEWHGRHLSD